MNDDTNDRYYVKRLRLRGFASGNAEVDPRHPATRRAQATSSALPPANHANWPRSGPRWGHPGPLHTRGPSRAAPARPSASQPMVAHGARYDPGGEAVPRPTAAPISTSTRFEIRTKRAAPKVTPPCRHRERRCRLSERGASGRSSFGFDLTNGTGCGQIDRIMSATTELDLPEALERLGRSWGLRAVALALFQGAGGVWPGGRCVTSLLARRRSRSRPAPGAGGRGRPSGPRRRR